MKEYHGRQAMTLGIIYIVLALFLCAGGGAAFIGSLMKTHV